MSSHQRQYDVISTSCTCWAKRFTPFLHCKEGELHSLIVALPEDFFIAVLPKINPDLLFLSIGTVQPVLSKHLRINKNVLAFKTGACLIQVHFNVFAFYGK